MEANVGMYGELQGGGKSLLEIQGLEMARGAGDAGVNREWLMAECPLLQALIVRASGRKARAKDGWFRFDPSLT